MYAEHAVNAFWYVLGALDHSALDCPFQGLKNGESVSVTWAGVRMSFLMAFSLNCQLGSLK